MSRSEIFSYIVRLAITALFVLFLWWIFQVKDILGALLLAGITSIIVSPLLGAQEKKGIPPILAIVFLFLGAICIVLICAGIIFPLLAEQIIRMEDLLQNTIHSLSTYANSPHEILGGQVEQVLKGLNITVDLTQVISFVGKYATEVLGKVGEIVTQGGGAVFSWIFGIFGVFSNIVLYFVFLFFALLERKELTQKFLSLLPKKDEKSLQKKTPIIQNTLLLWWRGQAILSGFIFTMTLIILGILTLFGIHVEHHVSLAVIAGICEFIPVIGPLIAMVPAALIGSQGGWFDVVILIVSYIAIQQTESLYLVPKVHGKSLRLSDFEVIVWMTLAGALFGVLGILFTLPILAVTKILISDS